jgi:DNA-binding PucR family transcriptional regulator
MTVRRLAQHRDLGLTLVAGRESGDRTISWAHAIELADPTPYLAGSELVMTTGMNVGATDTAQFDYLARLSSKGVAALAFDTGTTFADVPSGIIAAGDALGMPILAVPAHTPFIAITRAVIDEVTSDQLRAVQRIVDQQEAMARETLRNGIPGVITALGKALTATAVVVGNDGTVLAAAGPDTARIAELCRAHMTRHRSGKGSSRVVADGAGYCLMQGLRSAAPRGSHLAVRSDAPLAPPDRLLVAHAVALISLELDKPARVRDAEHRLRMSVTRLAMSAPSATDSGVLRYFGFDPANPVVVLILTNVGPLMSAEQQIRHAMDIRAVPYLLLAEGDEVLIVLPAATEGLAEELRHTIGAQLQRHVGGGLSSRGRFTGLDVLTSEARSAARAYPDRSTITSYATIGVFGVVLGNRTADELRLLSGQLAELDRVDEQDDSALLRTLQTYLHHNGSIETTATVVGVHRHTLRNRLAKITQLLDRDLAAADTRAELWLAYKAREMLAHGTPDPSTQR